MIKLQDFANQCGVTDRAIQKHLKKHEKELQGHFERKGPNGTWLDETAQAYIRSLMVTRLPVADAATLNELQELKDKNKELEERIERKDILYEKLQARLEEKENVLEDYKKQMLLIEDKNAEKIRAAEDKLKNELQEKYNQEVADLKRQLEEKQRELDEERNKGFFKRLFGR